MSDPLPEPGSMWAWPIGNHTFMVIASPGRISCTDENVDVLWNNGQLGFVVAYWFDLFDEDCTPDGQTDSSVTLQRKCCRRLG